MPEFNPTIHGNLRQPKSRGKLQTLIGQKFNRLTPLGFLGMIDNQAQWLCRCKCGKFWVATLQRLRNGQSQSCGCWNYDKPSANTTHGKSKTLANRCWSSIKTRCFNPKATGYDRYGGNGITICEGMQTFEGFDAVMGDIPEGKTSVDRYPNKFGGYWCGECEQCSKNGWHLNVRWADPKEQGSNLKKNVWLTANGETHIMSEWSRITGITNATMIRRRKKGQSDEEILGFAPNPSNRR